MTDYWAEWLDNQDDIHGNRVEYSLLRLLAAIADELRGLRMDVQEFRRAYRTSHYR